MAERRSWNDAYRRKGLPYMAPQDDLATPAGGAPQRWTRSKPTEPGWYWWRTVSVTPSKTVKIQVVQIGDGGYCWQEGEYTSNLDGVWQGPLTPNEATE